MNKTSIDKDHGFDFMAPTKNTNSFIMITSATASFTSVVVQDARKYSRTHVIIDWYLSHIVD